MDPEYEQKCKTGVSVIWTIETILESKKKHLNRELTYSDRNALINAYITGLDQDIQDMVRHWVIRSFN